MYDSDVQFVMGLVSRTLRTYNQSSDAIRYIKRLFEAEYGGNWSVIAGNSYSTTVTNDAEGYIHIKEGYCDVIIFPSN